MKKLLSRMPLLLCASSAWAFTPNVQPQKAVKVCARLSPKESRDACNKIIASASYDERAVGVCDVLKSTDTTLKCLDAIKDAPFYNHTAIRMCDRYEKDDDVIECLDSIAGEYLEDNAVKFCDKIYEDYLATDCLDTITGNTFDPGIIDKCASEASDEKKVECMDQYSKEATYEQLDELKNRPNLLKPTLDLSQFITPKVVSNCVPDKQDCNSNVEKQVKDSDDLVRRFFGLPKKPTK